MAELFEYPLYLPVSPPSHTSPQHELGVTCLRTPFHTLDQGVVGAEVSQLLSSKDAESPSWITIPYHTIPFHSISGSEGWGGLNIRAVIGLCGSVWIYLLCSHWSESIHVYVQRLVYSIKIRKSLYSCVHRSTVHLYKLCTVEQYI